MKESATGFMISPDLVLTNDHVLIGSKNSKDPRFIRPTGSATHTSYDARARALRLKRVDQMWIQFGFDEKKNENRPMFKLHPNRLMRWGAVSPGKGKAKNDWGLVAVDWTHRESTAASIPERPAFTPIPVRERLFTPCSKQFVNIIQHPKRWAKRFGIRGVGIRRLEDGRFTYTTDTLRGSSGSPVFDDFWQLVALHAAGLKDDIGNIGIDINVIISEIKSQFGTTTTADEKKLFDAAKIGVDPAPPVPKDELPATQRSCRFIKN